MTFEAAFQDELTKLGFAPLKSLRRLWRKLTGSQTGEEKFLDSHFKAPEWNKFHDSLHNPTFVSEVKQHPKADPKLQRFVGAMGGYFDGRHVTHVPGEHGSHYELRELKGGRVGCSCKDWRYNRSHKGEDCKHVIKWRDDKNQHQASGV